jgi:hypothetical protein
MRHKASVCRLHVALLAVTPLVAWQWTALAQQAQHAGHTGGVVASVEQLDARSLYRSDHLVNLTASDYKYLDDIGIRVVCDLRTPSERTTSPTT